MSFCHFSTNLHSQMGNNGSLVSLQSLQGNLSNLALRLAHEHLTGCSQHLLILTLDLNLGMETRRKCKRNVNTPWTLRLSELHNDIMESKGLYNIALKIFQPFATWRLRQPILWKLGMDITAAIFPQAYLSNASDWDWDTETGVDLVTLHIQSEGVEGDSV